MPGEPAAHRRPSSNPVLDRRTLNRTLLARQGLLERSDVATQSMIERLVGLQAQVPRDPYLSLRARIRDFEAASLETLFLERRVVRMTLMRSTIHLVRAEDAIPLRVAMQPILQRFFDGSSFRRRLAGIDVPSVVAAGTELLETEPMTVAELGRALHERWPDHDPEALAYAVRYLVPLVQVPPRGLLSRSGAARLAPLASWLGVDPAALDRPDEASVRRATESAVLRYLAAFGPATPADVRTWSGLPDVRGILERLGDRIRWRVDDEGRSLADVADGELASPDRAAPVRFLGEYDNVFLSHADRTRIAGDIAWGLDFIRRGAFFVDGFLAGPWQLSVGRGGPPTLTLEPRISLTRTQRDEAAAEGLALVRWLRADAGASAQVAWSAA
jgi:hypothetical protein